MAAIGTENSRACMHFLLRTLHTQLQRQVHLPGDRPPPGSADRRRGPLRRRRGERRRPDRHPSRSRARGRVRPAVLRAARLRLQARGEDPQRRRQPPAKPVPVPDRGRSGRRGSHPNCDGRLRHDDPRRPRLQGAPARHPRAGAQLPQLPLPGVLDRRRHSHPQLHRPDLPVATTQTSGRDGTSTACSSRSGPIPRSSSRRFPSRRRAKPSWSQLRLRAALQPREDAKPETASAKREVRVDYRVARAGPGLADSPVRRIVGRLRPSSAPAEEDPAPESVRELAFFDRINEVGDADQLTGVDSLPRLYEADYAILKLLDRAGLATRVLIGRATMPDRSANAVSDRLVKLYRHGLVAQHTIGIRQRSRTDGQAAAALLDHPARPRGRPGKKAGAGDLAQAGMASRSSSATRRASPHDLHALSWAIAFHRAVGKLATDNWRTPRYVTGRYPGAPRRIRTSTASDHHQRDPDTRWPGDDRHRAHEARRSETRRLARGQGRDDQAHLRSARRA